MVREIVKTAVENGQSLTVEGCYIPFNWREDFDASYLPHIRFLCLVFSEAYIRTRFDAIQTHANAIERRKDDSFCTMELLLAENPGANLEACRPAADCPITSLTALCPAPGLVSVTKSSFILNKLSLNPH